MTTALAFKLDRRQATWTPTAAVTVIGPKPLAPLADPATAIFRHLAEPDAGANLTAYLEGRKRAVVVVSDHTRAVGYRQWLGSLLDAVNLCGIPDERIELLVAVGLHDPEPESVTRATLGDAIFARVKVTPHHCKEAGELRPVRLANGGSVRVNRRLMEGAGTGVILTGGIGFHYHAGFGGGRKAVFPGCAAYEDVLANHRLLMDRTGPRGRNPHCQPGRLDGNPIYEQSIAVLQALPPAFLVNVVLAGNGAGEAQVGRFFCGDPFAAHRMGCDFVRAHGAVEIGAPADLVVAGAGGYPKDGSLYQAHKAYDNAARAVRPGGAMVLVAGLSEGLGPKAFGAALALGSIEEHREAMMESAYSIPAQTCLACREKAERNRTWVVGPAVGLWGDLKRIGFEVAETIEAAVAAATQHLAAGGCSAPRVVALPQAEAVLPQIAGQVVKL